MITYSWFCWDWLPSIIWLQVIAVFSKAQFINKVKRSMMDAASTVHAQMLPLVNTPARLCKNSWLSYNPMQSILCSFWFIHSSLFTNFSVQHCSFICPSVYSPNTSDHSSFTCPLLSISYCSFIHQSHIHSSMTVLHYKYHWNHISISVHSFIYLAMNPHFPFI